MESSYSRLYVFFITEGLDFFTKNFSIPSIDYYFLSTSLQNFEKTVSGIETGCKKTNINLILIQKEIATIETIARINKLFVEDNARAKPFFLFLSQAKVSDDEFEAISNAQNYFYLLPENPEPIDRNLCCYNLGLTIKFIFHKIVNIERLNDYIVSSFETIVDSAIITKQKNEIQNLNEELKAMSRTDFLTKVLNRRAFFEKLEEEKKRALRDNWRIMNAKADVSEFGNTVIEERRAQFPNAEIAGTKPVGMLLEHFGRFSCIMIDIDHFKMVNDNYGHLKGDEVLKTLAQAMSAKNIFRENDVLARFGGEEFIILLPGTSVQHAKIPADRFRQYIKSLEFVDEQGKIFKISISLGISEFRPTDLTNEEMINRADQALYYAKEHGRDQVVVYEDICGET